MDLGLSGGDERYLTIIIVSWNAKDELLQSLHAVERLEKLPVEHEIIVVDNASQDGTRQMLEDYLKTRPRVETRIILNPSNVGLSLATEQAFRLARGSRILLCNPDLLLDLGVTKLIEHSLMHPMEIITGELANSDGSVQRLVHRRFPSVARVFFGFGTVGRYLDTKIMGDLVHRTYCYQGDPYGQLPVYIDQPGATLLLLTSQVIKKIGGIFSSEFPVWWNDVDLAKRADRAGIPRVLLPRVRFLHSGGQSRKVMAKDVQRYIFCRSMIAFSKKWKMHSTAIRLIFVADAILGFLLTVGVQRAKGLRKISDFRRYAASQAAAVLAA